jgi:hypothetical protein
LEGRINGRWNTVRLTNDLKFAGYNEDDGDIKEFTVSVTAKGVSKFAQITELPRGTYRVTELTEGYAPTYVYSTEGGLGSSAESPGNGILVSGGSVIHMVTVTNHIAKPLIVEKHLANRTYTVPTAFEFELQTKNGDNWNAIPLAAVDGEPNVYRYAGAAGDVPDPSYRFVVRMPAGASDAQAQIEDLPEGNYRVVELTTGYTTTYGYAYDGANDSVPGGENEGLHIYQKRPEVGYIATVTNSVPSGGGGPTPPKPTTPETPATPPIITPPGDGGGNTNPPDGGGITPPAPGGNNPSVPPRPTVPGHNLTPAGDGVYIEIGDDGTPLGEWHWDEPTEQWIFDEYPPLANLPQTGFIGELEDTGRTVYPFICLITLLLLLAAAMPPIADMRRNSRDAQK